MKNNNRKFARRALAAVLFAAALILILVRPSKIEEDMLDEEDPAEESKALAA